MYDFGQTISLIIAMHIGTRMWNEEIIRRAPFSGNKTSLSAVKCTVPHRLCCRKKHLLPQLCRASTNFQCTEYPSSPLRIQKYSNATFLSDPGLIIACPCQKLTPQLSHTCWCDLNGVTLVAKDACPTVCLCFCEIAEHQAKNWFVLCRSVLHAKQGARGLNNFRFLCVPVGIYEYPWGLLFSRGYFCTPLSVWITFDHLWTSPRITCSGSCSLQKSDLAPPHHRRTRPCQWPARHSGGRQRARKFPSVFLIGSHSKYKSFAQLVSQIRRRQTLNICFKRR